MQKTRFKKAILFSLILCLALSGCARPPKRTSASFITPPVSAGAGAGFYHEVQRKQTFYAIAKKYGLDWHELARLNHITDPSKLEVGQKIFIPQPQLQAVEPALPGPLSYSDVRRLVGPPRRGSIWRTITVHHSGTHRGNAQLFHRDHTRRHMGGLFYHFVIGNGTNSRDGALEMGFRWQRQIKANRPYDIQICLVGDFNDQFVSEAQFSTLVTLIRILREDYGIPLGNIRKHEDIKGKHTACPGRHFPFQRLLSELGR